MTRSTDRELQTEKMGLSGYGMRCDCQSYVKEYQPSVDVQTQVNTMLCKCNIVSTQYTVKAVKNNKLKVKKMIFGHSQYQSLLSQRSQY